MQLIIGDFYTGTVAAIKEYGAFISLQDGTKGMVHISQLSTGFVKKVEDVLQIGQQVQVRLLSNEGGKLALSMLPQEKRNLQRTEDFEKMLSRFKDQSDEKLSEYNRSRQVKKQNGKHR